MVIVATVLPYAPVFRGSSKFLPSLVPAIGWGAMFPIADSAIKHVDPFHLTMIRYILAAIGFLALLWAFEGARALRLERPRARAVRLRLGRHRRASTCSRSPGSSTPRPSTPR